MAEIITNDKKKFSATYRVENIVMVSKFPLENEIPLEKVAQAYSDVEFNVNRFPGVCIRLIKPKCAILLFSNGKMVLTGLKFQQDGDRVIEKIIERLNNIGITITEVPELKIVNIVTSLNFRRRLDLDRASLLLTDAIYEPEVFPGLIFRIFDPQAVFLIFSTGKVVLTGIKTEAEIVPAIKYLGITLKNHGFLD